MGNSHGEQNRCVFLAPFPPLYSALVYSCSDHTVEIPQVLYHKYCTMYVLADTVLSEWTFVVIDICSTIMVPRGEIEQARHMS